jgi:hypothetical protein
VVRIGYAEIGIGQQRGIRLEWKEHMLNENQPGIGCHAVLVPRDKYIYIYAEKSEEKLVGDITKTLLSTGL